MDRSKNEPQAEQDFALESPISDLVTTRTATTSTYRGELPVDAWLSCRVLAPQPTCSGSPQLNWAVAGPRHPTQTSPGHPSALTPRRGVNPLNKGPPHVLLSTVTHLLINYYSGC